MTDMEEFDTYGTHYPVCPHCGSEKFGAWEFDFDNECEEVNCGVCEKPFVIIRNVYIDYTTKKPKGYSNEPKENS
jgi:transcription elongation factor Elf1